MPYKQGWETLDNNMYARKINRQVTGDDLF